jgi:hypothetical protein
MGKSQLFVDVRRPVGPKVIECPGMCRFLDAGNNQGLGTLS